MPSERSELRPNLSVLALLSFIAAFLIARAFTTLYPNVVLVSGGFHIHHFWFGLAMMAIGGWLGITYRDERADRLAAILFGAGGGLIGDEVGLLLTFGDYRTGLTYTLVVTFVIFFFSAHLLEQISPGHSFGVYQIPEQQCQPLLRSLFGRGFNRLHR